MTDEEIRAAAFRASLRARALAEAVRRRALKGSTAALVDLRADFEPLVGSLEEQRNERREEVKEPSRVIVNG